MNRVSVCAVSVAIVASISACSLSKQSTANENSNQPAQSNIQSAQTGGQPSPAKSETAPQPATQAGDLQPGQASGTYTAKGETVELKYAYAGRGQRFGDESMIILLTEKPIPPEAVAEELKSTPLLEGEKIRGLEYAIMDNGMWVRYHPGQYQESGTMKLKDYRVENDVVRGVDENDGGLSNGKYARSVKFVAAITK